MTPTLLLSLLACTTTTTPGPENARRWAESHAITLDAVRLPTERLLINLPSLPGARFLCSGFVWPPEISEAERERMSRDLCRQQEAMWETERREAEEEQGTSLLTGAFLHYGVVGVTLTVGGPEGNEWEDHRGIEAFSDSASVPAKGSGIRDEMGALLGYGMVDLRIEPETPLDLHPALEWRYIARRGEATAEVRLFVQMDGHPNADFVRYAMSR